MRKPNWKRKGYISLKAAKTADVFARAAMIRERKLKSLPPEIRMIVGECPELEGFI